MQAVDINFEAMENRLNDLGEIVIFSNENGEIGVQVDAINETIWMNQKGIAELFDIDVSGVSRHISNIYECGELEKDTTIAKIANLVQNGFMGTISKEIEYYNLDVIIAVGYRVNSKRATQFRIWATKILRQYLVKGFALDDERFKKGRSLNHFKELIERIRAIRVSERFFYQQIKDIYKLSEDYDAKDEVTIEFFKKIQNKLLWAVSGKTAAELVYYRSNAALPLMGLTTTEIEGIVRTTDIGIGKNYLSEEELSSLKLIVEQYLSFAEAQAQAHRPMYMQDWITNLDLILQMNRKEILTGAGKISAELAKKRVREVFADYKEKIRIEEKINSLKELEADLRNIKGNTL